MGSMEGTGGEPALAAARREVATLREVFEAIQDALLAAAARLEAIELSLGDGAAAAGARAAQAPAPPLRPGRTPAEWKLAGWPPARGAEGLDGETLRARREALGLSQAAVAHAANCARSLVAEIERGKRRSAHTLAHLAEVLDRLEQQSRRN